MRFYSTKKNKMEGKVFVTPHQAVRSKIFLLFYILTICTISSSLIVFVIVLMLPHSYVLLSKGNFRVTNREKREHLMNTE